MIALHWNGVEEVYADVVSLIHRKGYGLILWVINDPEDIVAACSSKPDFIETDNDDFKNYISRKKQVSAPGTICALKKQSYYPDFLNILYL